MNSSSSTLLDIDPKTLSKILAIAEEQPIASIIFIVKREFELEVSLRIEILYLPREKKNQIA